MGFNDKCSESRTGRPDTQDFFTKPFGNSCTPRVCQAGIPALIIDRSIIGTGNCIPRRTEDFKKSSSSVADLPSPTIIDGYQSVIIFLYFGQGLYDKILIERRIRQSLHTVGKSFGQKPPLLFSIRKSGINSIGCRMYPQFVCPIRIHTQRINLFPGISLISGCQFFITRMVKNGSKLIPCLYGKHSISMLRLGSRTLKSAQTFIPAIKSNDRVFIIMMVGNVQFLTGIFQHLIQQSLVTGIHIIVNQTQYPIKGITGNAIILGGSIAEVLLHKIIVTESHHGGSLRGMRIPRP